jgi:hypothetical protein
LANAPYWTWFCQLGLLVAGGFLYFFVPGLCLGALSGIESAALSPLAVDQLRMSSPYLFGLGGFTLFALMTQRTALRPRFATVFAMVFSVWAVVQWIGVGAQRYAGSGVLAAILATLLALANARLAWLPAIERLAPEDGGVRDTKPPQAFALWLLQGIVLTGGSLAFLFAPATVLSQISGNPIGSALLTPLAIDQTRLLGALATGMSALSFVAIVTQRSFAWRGFSFFFSCFLAIWVVSIAWILVWGHYALPVLAVLVPGLLFLPMNVSLYGLQGEWDPEGASRTPDAWSVLDLVAGPLMAIFVVFTRRRSSHLVGVAARGEFHPAAAAAGVPAHEFFAGGEVRPVQVRFANLTELDDASLDVRGCAIKFSEHRHDSPFDLLLNTGSFCPAFNLWTFAGFVASKFVPRKGSELIVRRNLIAREGGVAGLRRAPESYARLYYHGQIVRDWVSSDGGRHLVRYRCAPADLGRESGLPDDADAARIWVRDRLPGDHRAVDYLRRELRERLDAGPVAMRLQAQFHRPRAGDSEEWYNASVDWDESSHPWRDLGILELREAIDDADAEVLQFDPGNHPPTLGIPTANRPGDYRSMGDSEARVVRALQRLRLWMYGAFGLPPLGPGARR